MFKTCKDCKEEKEASLEFFYKEKRNKDGLTGNCRVCIIHQKKSWHEQNKDRLKNNRKQINKKHYEKYGNTIREKARERMKTPIAKERAKTRMRKLRENNPSFKISSNVSRAIRNRLTNNGHYKKCRTFEALPYTPQQLKEHLESQFNENMNWDNYGSYWHIDHVYPQSLLPYESLEDDNFKKCWELNNLRPLEAIENIKKSNKLTS